MASLKEIRAKLQAQAARSAGNPGENASFPHWNLADNSHCVVRFLKDGDSNNDYFWREKLTIKLPFQGMVGGDMSREVIVNVPCMEMYGESCPIIAETRPWWKDDSMAEMAKKYWKKKSYIYQGLVVDPGTIKEDTVPENPIRKFMLNTQIHNIVKSALMDPDIEENPTDEFRGLDFKIVKTSKGQYADYSTSSFARRERALTQEELGVIEKNGLFKLFDSLPTKPTDVELKVIMEMFEASVDGKPYDQSRWGQYFRPYGQMRDDTSHNQARTEARDTAVRVTSQAKPAAVLSSTPSTGDESDYVPRRDARVEPEIRENRQPETTVAASDGNDASARARAILAKINARKAGNA